MWRLSAHFNSVCFAALKLAHFLGQLEVAETHSNAPHLADPDSRGRSGEAGLAGFELTAGAEVSLTEAVDSCHPEPVRLTGKQLPPLSALVVLRPRRPPAGKGLMGKQKETKMSRRRRKQSGDARPIFTSLLVGVLLLPTAATASLSAGKKKRLTSEKSVLKTPTSNHSPLSGLP